MYSRIEQTNKHIVNNVKKRKRTGGLKWAIRYRVENSVNGIKQQRPVAYSKIHKPLLWKLYSVNNSKAY